MLRDKFYDVAASGEGLGAAVVKGMENAETAIQRTVEVATAGSGKLTSSLGHLGDGVSQISHDVQTGAKNTENALSGVQDAVADTSAAAGGISSASVSYTHLTLPTTPYV